MFIKPLRIRNRLLVQFKVTAVAYWLIRRSRSVGSRPGLVLGDTLSFHSAFLHRGSIQRGYIQMNWYLIQGGGGGVITLLVA